MDCTSLTVASKKDHTSTSFAVDCAEASRPRSVGGDVGGCWVGVGGGGDGMQLISCSKKLSQLLASDVWVKANFLNR